MVALVAHNIPAPPRYGARTNFNPKARIVVVVVTTI
jgi:hypothetical protein